MDDQVNAVVVAAPNLSPSAAYVYDALTGTTLHSYKGLQLVNTTLCVSGPDEYVFAACKERSLVQAWSLNKHEPLDVRFYFPGRIIAMDVSPTPPTMLVAALGEVMHVHHLESGSRVVLIKRHFQPVTCIAFFPCGAYFASAGEDGFVYVWSVASLTAAAAAHGHANQNVKPYKQLGQHSDKVTCMRVSGGTEGRLVTGSADHTCLVYDLYTLCLLHTLVLNSPVSAVAITLMATRVLVATDVGNMAVVDLSPSLEPSTIRLTDEMCNVCHEGLVTAAAFLLSGNTVVSAGQDGEVKVWAVEGSSEGAVASFDAATSNPGDAGGGAKLRLALQRTLHRNKGPVSNMAVLLVDRRQLSNEFEDRPGVQRLTSFHPNAWADTAVTVPPPPPAMRSAHTALGLELMRQFCSERCHLDRSSIDFLLNR